MDIDYFIKRYQSKLNTRLERLRNLKSAAASGGFGDTDGLDTRIESMVNELARLQKVKYDLRETNFDQFVCSEIAS